MVDRLAELPAPIEFAGSKDARSVSRLFRQVLTDIPYYNSQAIRTELDKFDVAQLKEWIVDDPLAVLVARQADVIVGFCINRLDDDLIWLEWFGVHPDHRRQGIASAMLKSLEQAALLRGAHKVWCDSRTNNIESIAILTRHAYRRLCTLENHWHGQDYLLWEKPLT